MTMRFRVVPQELAPPPPTIVLSRKAQLWAEANGYGMELRTALLIRDSYRKAKRENPDLKLSYANYEVLVRGAINVAMKKSVL